MAVAHLDDANVASTRVETIEELFSALESPLLGYARRLVPDPALAEDVVQDAFMKLHAQNGTVREPRRWLYRTVHNLALNQRRDARKIVPLETPPGDPHPAPPETPDPGPLPDEAMARWESIGLVRAGLAALDERSRELVQLKFHEELSYQEMSTRTGLTIGHVGYLLHHALKAIASELAKTGILP